MATPMDASSSAPKRTRPGTPPGARDMPSHETIDYDDSVVMTAVPFGLTWIGMEILAEQMPTISMRWWLIISGLMVHAIGLVLFF